MTIDVDELFFPSQAIKAEKEFFAGRKTLLLDAVKAINTPGTSVVFYGERGIGKTSIAWQLHDILQKNNILYNLWNIKPIALKHDFKCVWVKCREYMSSTEDILLKLMMPSSERSTFYHVFPEVFENERFLDSIKTKFKIDLKIISTELEDTEKERENYYERSKLLLDRKATIHAIFEEVLLEVKRHKPNSEIVIFIDEVDRLEDKKGLGSLIKDTDNARFVFIGIADSLNLLIADHKSITRKLGTSAFNLDGLNEIEIKWIFDKVQNKFPKKVAFDDDFISQVIMRSGGYPYLVQKFGHSSLNYAMETLPGPVYRITSDHFNVALTNLISFQEGFDEYSNVINLLYGESTIKIEILYIVSLSGMKWTSLDYIKERISAKNLKRWVGKNVEELVKDNNILKYKIDDEEQIKFADPISRMIVQLHKEKSN